MADKKISELPAASAIGGTEKIPVVQAGVTKRTTPDEIAAYIAATGGGGGAPDLTIATGNLAVSHLDSGTGADNTKYWRGDATWAVPAGGGAPDLTTATGNLAVSHLDSGTNASNVRYWRGDGTWQVPPGTGGSVVPLGFIYAADYGVVANTATDMTDNLQAAVDDATYVKHAKLVLPSGYINISKTIQCGYGVSGFTSTHIIGQGRQYAGESSFTGTAIIATHVDGPAFNIQGGRNVVIEDVTILGQNNSYLSASGAMGGSPAFDDSIEENWLDPAILTLNADAMSRYAPYAGITVDAYSGTQPTPHYPDVTYPEALVGAGVAQYGKNASSNTQLNRVEMRGFVAGLVIQPCDYDGNGDFVTLTKCGLYNCAYAVSVGNSQSRNVGMTDCAVETIHTILAGIHHGVQRGRFGGTITNLSAGACYQIINADAPYACPITFTNFYAELLYRIGDMLTAAQDSALVFVGSSFDFGAQLANTARGVPQTLFSGSNISFEGCTFTNYPDVLSIHARAASHQDCNFTPRYVPTNIAERLAHNGVAGGFVFTQGNASVTRPRYEKFNADTGSSVFPSEPYPGGRSDSSATTHAWERALTTYVQRSSGALVWHRPLIMDVDRGTQIFSFARSGRTVSFDLHSWNEYAQAIFGPSPGDVIYDGDGGVYRVDSVSGSGTVSVVTTMMNNYGTVGGVFVPLVTIATTGTTWWILNTRRYLAGHTTYISAALGSSDVVVGANALATDFGVGDWMFTEDWPGWSAGGGQISAINSGTNTLTLTGTATVALNSVLAPPFVRKTF